MFGSRLAGMTEQAAEHFFTVQCIEDAVKVVF
jgi:hypothetical protein